MGVLRVLVEWQRMPEEAISFSKNCFVQPVEDSCGLEVAAWSVGSELMAGHCGASPSLF